MDKYCNELDIAKCCSKSYNTAVFSLNIQPILPHISGRKSYLTRLTINKFTQQVAFTNECHLFYCNRKPLAVLGVEKSFSGEYKNKTPFDIIEVRSGNCTKNQKEDIQR